MRLSAPLATVSTVTERPLLPTPNEAAIRAELLQLVRNDLLGPLGGDDEEFSGENPIDRYPLGRLAPRGDVIEPENHDELGEAATGEPADPDDEPSAPNVPSLNPSALGFTVCVSTEVAELDVTAKWARYQRVRSESKQAAGATVWRRFPMGGTVRVPLMAGVIAPVIVTQEQPDVVVRGRARKHKDTWLVSLFLENLQTQPEPKKRHAPAWLFQVELSAAGVDEAAVFLPRPDQFAGGDAQDKKERKALAMAHRFQPEFAVGSATAVHATVAADDPMRAIRISTSTMPVFEVPATDVPDPEWDDDLPALTEVTLDMKRLAELADGQTDDLLAAIKPLLVGYRSWIEDRKKDGTEPDKHLDPYKDEAKKAIEDATVAADRIEEGIKVLDKDSKARSAFGFANRAMYLQRVHTMATALRRKTPAMTLDDALHQVDTPENRSWRPFQLAFILLNLPALADPKHPERAERETATADLLWFPTGGGKTEAYLGLIAFTLAIRRLHPQLGGLDASAGVAVLMRYTLRLLTIQQFERATTLICAAETLRRADPDRWGGNPFRIGLWVGGRVTPNTTDGADAWSSQKRKGTFRARGYGSPHQLSNCPWCGAAIDSGRGIEVDMVRRRTYVVCPDPFCPFSGSTYESCSDPAERRGLPVLVVDEEIYRHPPSLLIATVDKFAQLPWKGETTALFGRVTARCERHGYISDDLAKQKWEAGSHDTKGNVRAPRTIRGLTQLRPPDLIIQDELHLISGPLGSLVGLYETAIDRLCSWEHPESRTRIRPKVIASTATVRRADRQLHMLFHRKSAVFPPPGLEAKDNFFARQRPTARKPGRLYVGICAHGIRLKSTLIRVYVSVLGAAQRLHEKYGRNEVTDPYMTLVGYFSSLRDLGGMRRLVEDDVSSRLTRAHQRGLARRFDLEMKELTSRMASDRIRPLLDQLEVPFPRPKNGNGKVPPIDVLLATNMIAVGVDVSRLGLMVVTNQPKSAAEYIQATSRVGRSKKAPGLVFTVYNWARPRDLSHYETFEHFHGTLYRSVEALSVTPFADRALDRGLTGVLAALVRQIDQQYNANTKAKDFARTSERADHVHRYLVGRANTVDRDTKLRVDEMLDFRLDHWERERTKLARQLVYVQPEQVDAEAGLLERPGLRSWSVGTCPTSLRDVEPSVPLLLQPLEESSEAEPDFRPSAAAGQASSTQETRQ
jgi:hypothetical protein